MTKKRILLEDSGNGIDEAVAAAVRAQQQILLVRQISLVMPINIVIAILVAGFMTTFSPLWPVLGWLAAMLVVSVSQLVGAWKLRQRPPPVQVSGRSLERAEFWAAFIGLLWASIIVIFYAGETVRNQMFLALVLVGLASGGVAMLQAIPRVSGWFAGTILAPLIVRFVLDGDPLHLTVALLSVIFFYTLMNSSRLAFWRLRTIVESVLGFERARSDLVDAIESIKDAFAIYDRDGNIKLANERFKSWFGDCGNLSEVPGTGGLYRLPGGIWLRGSLRPMSDGGQVSVHTDVTELKNRERELISAKLAAEEASSAKSQFLANMSHELRTPLNAIIGFAEVMRKGMFGPLGAEKYKQYAEDIHDSARNLLAIITDILNLARIQSSGYELEVKEIDIRKIVRWVVGACVRQHGEFDPERIEIRIDPQFGLLRADPAVLKTVLHNLVSNAIKFTEPSGQVIVEAFVDRQGRPCISVSDTGIGIARDQLNAVRQPFQRLEDTLRRKFRGTGLGLPIADTLVKLHGGRMDLESRKGQGTRATVILPAKCRKPDQRAARAS